jgi:hypothetical protein
MPTFGEMVLAKIAELHAAQLSSAAKRLSTPEDTLLHVCLDPHFDLAGYLKEPDLFALVLKTVRDTASCYPTAEKLFPIIADGSTGGSGGLPSKTLYHDAQQVQTAVAGLVAAIRQGITSGQDRVYRVELAAHGFTLVVRRPSVDAEFQVELLETIANFAIIVPSLRKPPKTPDVVCTALTLMVDDDIAKRRTGADTMGWDARDFWLAEQVGKDPVFPDIRFSWWSGALRADAVQQWLQQFSTRLQKV